MGVVFSFVSTWSKRDPESAAPADESGTFFKRVELVSFEVPAAAGASED